MKIQNYYGVEGYKQVMVSRRDIIIKSKRRKICLLREQYHQTGM